MDIDETLWHGDYKIPWNEPEFSRRMLAEHLSQDHDLASRRTEWIDRQVEWIHHRLLGGRTARILDLGCGPGFYLHRLSNRGHGCRGIDFGTASVEYATSHNPYAARCEFVLGDLREENYEGPYDLAMILYGEFNVFSPREISLILQKVYASLIAGGKLIVEVQTSESVERMGRSKPTEQDFASGLFSDRPYRCRTDSTWIDEKRVAVQTFSIFEGATTKPRVYRNTTQSWPEHELKRLFSGAGYREVSLCNDWPCNVNDLALWLVG